MNHFGSILLIHEIFWLLYCFEEHFFHLDSDNPRTVRFKKVLKDYLSEGKSIKQISYELNIDVSRVRTILNQGICYFQSHLLKMSKFLKTMSDVTKELNISHKELEFHLKECVRLSLLNDKLNEREKTLKILEKRLLGADNKLDIEISKLEVSNRIKNTFESIGIYTLEGIIRFKKNDLLKMRNFGSKSVTELEELFNSLNIPWQ